MWDLFDEINEMPIIVDLAKLDDGGGIEDTLRKNQAQYHRSCRLMFNNDKLGRARKRKSKTQSNERDESDESHDMQSSVERLVGNDN